MLSRTVNGFVRHTVMSNCIIPTVKHQLLAYHMLRVLRTYVTSVSTYFQLYISYYVLYLSILLRYGHHPMQTSAYVCTYLSYDFYTIRTFARYFCVRLRTIVYSNSGP